MTAKTMTFPSDNPLPHFSVLMSVYLADRAEYVSEAVESILSQTVKTDDFVIVCDGPLNEEVDKLLNGYEDRCPEIRILRLSENSGLGVALNHGLAACRHDIVARMDSDDISASDRFQLQLNEFAEDNTLDILSGTVLEFKDSTSVITGRRRLPSSYEDIIVFSRKRNPFNHPCVMLRKQAVQAAGGYSEEFHLMEDYYLWVRMLRSGCKGRNIDRDLLYMRVDDATIGRRGGLKYSASMLRFHNWLLKTGWIGCGDYITGALPHALICILPLFIRRRIYKLLH